MKLFKRVTALAIGGLVSTIFVAEVLQASPVPHMQEPCPSDHPQTTSGVVTGPASGCWSSPSSAEFFAEDKLRGKLARISGVVCSICEDGLQCSRTVMFNSPGISFTDISGDCDLGSFAATASYDGAYTVKCGFCPITP